MNKAWLIVAAGAALLAVLFFLFRPDAPAPDAPAQPATEAPGVAREVPEPKIFTLVVEQGRLKSGPELLEVTQGDEVILRVSADRPGELHLHGYDLSLNVAPNLPAELRFTADKSGRFEYELHGAQGELGALEVQPK